MYRKSFKEVLKAVGIRLAIAALAFFTMASGAGLYHHYITVVTPEKLEPKELKIRWSISIDGMDKTVFELPAKELDEIISLEIQGKETTVQVEIWEVER